MTIGIGIRGIRPINDRPSRNAHQRSRDGKKKFSLDGGSEPLEERPRGKKKIGEESPEAPRRDDKGIDIVI